LSATNLQTAASRLDIAGRAGQCRPAAGTTALNMPKFRYQALDTSGELIAGEIDADSSGDVFARLETLGHMPIEATELRSGSGSSGGRFSLFGSGPNREEITEITRDLSMLLKGGVGLHEALELLSQMGGRLPLRNLMAVLQREIAQGKSFAEALSAHPKHFPRTYAKMVEAAESAGTLEETLDKIAAERSRSEALRRRVTSSLTYPLFLVVAACGVFLFVMLKVIPEFERALSGFADKLDPSAQAIFAMSQFVRANIDYIFVGVALLLLIGLLLARSRGFQGLLLRILGRLPGTRRIVQFQQTVFFCSTLGTLLGSGVDITTTLRLIRDVMRDSRAAAKVDQLIAEIRQGHRVSDALATLDLLPDYVVPILRVGEEAGELDTMSLRIGGFYEDRLDRALTRLTSVLGPTILIAVSMMIAWLIVTVITALISVNDLLV
jgi:general secretion pathway protein F